MAESELDLVNKVDLRLALADSDKQLETAVSAYLPPLLLKLASNHGSVRQAVFKIIQNVFPRISAARELKLPVDALLSQTQNPNISAGSDPTQVRLYSLLFLSKGIERLSVAEKNALIPKLLIGYHAYPSNIACRVFAALMKCLTTFTPIPRDSDEYEVRRKELGFNERPEDERAFLRTVAKFFLLLPNANAPIQTPGMSVADSAFFTKDAGVSYKSLKEIQEAKLHMLDFLGAGFQERLLALPLLIASADSSSAINNRAELWFKKITIDLEDFYLVNEMVDLFLGKTEPVTPPVSPSLQDRILALLCKSDVALKHQKLEEISQMALNSDYVRLRQTSVAFIRRVTKAGGQASSSQNSTDEFNSSILSTLKSNIMSDGWPELDASQVANYRSASNSRQLQYEAIGDIMRNSTGLWKSDMTYIRFLFDSLEGESVDIRPTVQDVLSSLEPYLMKLSSECKAEMKQIVRKYLEFSTSETSTAACRYVAMKFSNATFPFSDAEARYLCFLGASKTNNPEVIEEANKGLHPYYFNLLQESNNLDFQSSREFLGVDSTVRFPAFNDIVKVLRTGISQAEEDSTLYQSLGTAVRFIYRTLVMESVGNQASVIVTDEDWDARVDKALEVDQNIKDLVSKEIAKPQKQQSVYDFISILFDSFYNSHYGGAHFVSDTGFSTILASILSLCSPQIISSLKSSIPKLLTLIDEKVLWEKSLQEACKALSIISINEAVSDADLKSILKSFEAPVGGATSGKLASRLLAQAYIISRIVLTNRQIVLEPDYVKSFIKSLLEAIQESRHYDVVLECLSQLTIFGALGPSLKLYDDVEVDVAAFSDIVLARAKKSHELSVLTLSRIQLAIKSTYGRESQSELSDAEQVVFDTHTSKQLDYMLASGEAFVILAGSWRSSILRQEIDVQGSQILHIPDTTARLAVILDHVLKACANTKPSLRRAACIWLLSLVQYLNSEKAIAANGARIHLAFMRFLADRDELVQESASRGLSIIYELGDVELKDTLVKSLFRSFTDPDATSSLTAGTVDQDTQLFDPDVLKTHDGSVSTYRDVLNLAQDVGDPGLVYKFMSLAKSNALWSSRRGMAFGLGLIMAKSSLDEMLANNQALSNRLIPKLYRYRFDPNSGVSKSMNDIWTALIKDGPKTIKKHFDLILNEILKTMGSKEWRVRQASTSALSNLLQTQPIEQYESRLEEIWGMSFRAMDDIKESVRKEGSQLCRQLARTLARLADVKTGNVTVEKATQILNYLIPFFLGTKGLQSDAEDVREFALETILKLCKVGGAAIRPHISKLLSSFIELMSTLEPEIVNYLMLNAEKYNVRTSDVDARRLQSVNASPMMDAIDKILNLADEDLMPDIVQSIRKSVKASVGLPSKVCGSRVIVNLISKNYFLSKPYGDALLEIAVSQLTDRNSTVASSYAAAAGYACKIASMKAVLDYSQLISKRYLEADDEGARVLAAIASESVSRYSGQDRFQSVASAFLPLVFVGKHDESEEVKEIFSREWIECSTGNSAVKLYFDEILQISSAYGKSNNYYVRQVIARSIADMCNAVEITSQKQSTALFELLLEFSKGKSWSGKELVFDALVSFAVTKAEFVEANTSLFDEICDTVQVEAKRRNKAYQVKAVLSLGKFIHQFPAKTDLVDQYVDIMGEVLSEDYLEELDVIEQSQQKNVNKSQEPIIFEEFNLSLLSNIFEAVSAKNLNPDLLNFAFESLAKFKNSGVELTWRTCSTYNECFKRLLDGLAAEETSLSASQLDLIAKAYAILFEFGDKGLLEKNLIMLARNSRTLLQVFRNNGGENKTEFVLKYLQSIPQDSISSITQNEITTTIEEYK